MILLQLVAGTLTLRYQMPARPNSPSDKAAKTARWATTMTKWAIRYCTNGKRAGTKRVKEWQIVSFLGPHGSESRGIVDLMAIRRDHGFGSNAIKSGDFFEIILIQVKGGSAPDPTAEDIKRLLAVKKRYHAKMVVLASWQKGSEPEFSILGSKSWSRASAVDIFGG